MSKFKRLVSSVAASAILVSGISVTSFASVSTDVIGTQFEEAAKVLRAFDIMVGDGGSGLFRPNDPITRGEVTKVAVALKGLSHAANSSVASRFPDVADTHWAKGFINVGSSEGLVIGDDKGNFRPDDKITYAEAVTILVRALGYEPQAQSKGGYPTGYLVTGNLTGITDGVSAVMARSTNDITRGEVAQLAYNSININLMEQTGFGSGEKYEITDETLLTSKHDAKLIHGKVTAVGASSIEGEGVAKDEIMIGDKVYTVANADVRSILGLNVDAYIGTSGKNRDKVLVVVPSKNQNSITTIVADDLDSVTSSGITYYKGSKKTKISIPQGSYVVYNGMAADTDALKMIEAGYISVVENDKAKKIVFINETENYVVDEVVLSSGRVIDKYGKSPLVLDEDNEDISFVIEKDNKVISPSELNEWDVLTVTVSGDKNLIYGSVTNSSVEGTVTGKSSDAVHIADKEYKVAKNYTKQISINDEGVFYLDAEGKIAAFKEANTNVRDYAFLNNIAVENGFKGKLKLELFTAKGDVIVANGASSVKVDGKSYSDPQKALEAIGGKGQLVSVALNSNNEITSIKKSTESKDVNENIFALNFSEKGVKYSSKSSKLLADAMNISVDDETVVFDIPSDAKNAEDYSISGKSFFTDGDKYDIIVYDVAEDLTAGAIIVTSSENKASEESAAVIVEKIASVRDENGDTVDKLYGYQNGEKVSFVSENNLFVKDGKKLEAGDIIQIKADSKGTAKAIRVLFDSDKAEDEFAKDISENLSLVYGKVTKKFSSSFNLSADGGKENNYSAAGANIYIADSTKNSNKITKGDISDIQKYDELTPERVFIRLYKGEVKDIVIIK